MTDNVGDGLRDASHRHLPFKKRPLPAHLLQTIEFNNVLQPNVQQDQDLDVNRVDLNYEVQHLQQPVHHYDVVIPRQSDHQENQLGEEQRDHLAEAQMYLEEERPLRTCRKRARTEQEASKPRSPKSSGKDGLQEALAKATLSDITSSENIKLFCMARFGLSDVDLLALVEPNMQTFMEHLPLSYKNNIPAESVVPYKYKEIDMRYSSGEEDNEENEDKIVAYLANRNYAWRKRRHKSKDAESEVLPHMETEIKGDKKEIMFVDTRDSQLAKLYNLLTYIYNNGYQLLNGQYKRVPPTIHDEKDRSYVFSPTQKKMEVAPMNERPYNNLQSIHNFGEFMLGDIVLIKAKTGVLWWPAHIYNFGNGDNNIEKGKVRVQYFKNLTPFPFLRSEDVLLEDIEPFDWQFTARYTVTSKILYVQALFQAIMAHGGMGYYETCVNKTLYRMLAKYDSKEIPLVRHFPPRLRALLDNRVSYKDKAELRAVKKESDGEITMEPVRGRFYVDLSQEERTKRYFEAAHERFVRLYLQEWVTNEFGKETCTHPQSITLKRKCEKKAIELGLLTREQIDNISN